MSEFAFLQKATDTSGQTTYSFTSQNLGTADLDRYIIVSVLARSSGTGARSISSCSIGGVSAEVAVLRQTIATNSNTAALIIAKVPTGTSGTISITFSGAMVRCGIAAYRAVGLITSTPFDTASSGASNPSFTYEVPANGVVIACSTTAATATASLSGFVENWDEQVSFNAMSSYSWQTDDYSVVTGYPTVSDTITWTSSSESAGALAVWGFKGVDDWYNGDWNYRKMLVLKDYNNGGTGSATNVPVCVNLTELGQDFWTNIKDNGADIRITTDDGVTEVPIEVVFCDKTTDKGELYFRAPLIDSAAHYYFYIYYGNSAASAYSPSDTYGRDNVWSNGYELVLHFQETTGSYVDSTGNGYDSTSVTATARNAAGMAEGNAVDLSGSSDVIEFGDVLDMGTNDMTIFHCIKTSQTPANYAFTASKSFASAGNFRYAVGIHGNPAKARVFIQGDGGSDVDFSGSSTVNNNAWHPLHYVFDRDGLAEIWRFASTDGSSSIASWGGKDFQSNHPFRLGAYTQANNTSLTLPYNGLMDEFRLSFVTRNSRWISVEVNYLDNSSIPRGYGQQEEYQTSSSVPGNGFFMFM